MGSSIIQYRDENASKRASSILALSCLLSNSNNRDETGTESATTLINKQKEMTQQKVLGFCAGLGYSFFFLGFPSDQ